MVERFLYDLNILDEVTIYNVKRFGWEINKEKPGAVKLDFKDLENKPKLYQALMKKVHEKSNVIRGISIVDEIPQSLRSQQKDLDGRSFKLRKICREYRPRIIVSGRELAIRFWINGSPKPKV